MFTNFSRSFHIHLNYKVEGDILYLYDICEQKDLMKRMILNSFSTHTQYFLFIPSLRSSVLIPNFQEFIKPSATKEETINISFTALFNYTKTFFISLILYFFVQLKSKISQFYLPDLSFVSQEQAQNHKIYERVHIKPPFICLLDVFCSFRFSIHFIWFWRLLYFICF